MENSFFIVNGFANVLIPFILVGIGIVYFNKKNRKMILNRVWNEAKANKFYRN